MVRSVARRHVVFVALRALGACGVLALAVSCEKTDTPITPTTTFTITENFTGTLNPNGAATFPFSSTAAGSVTASLDKVDPSSIGVGLALGTWNGSSCAILIANDNALQTAQIVGNATSASALCVRIYDIGKVTSAAAYTISVIHP